ncbi:tyrosine-type recombinase/integrase [Saccharopolyspora spinosa]|uniref:tyrosine-type recombinase/integrase n=1 Tax=Saccharopolyspora spinosa TaxID=60894 RepID=UPI00031F142B|nr:tyrosine-type recombinase/integrase [Saccharopolyspora spinosa]
MRRKSRQLNRHTHPSEHGDCGHKSSYVTHLIEDGFDTRLVQEQAGHDHASTTAIYTCVSSDFRTRTVRRALDAQSKPR